MSIYGADIDHTRPRCTYVYSSRRRCSTEGRMTGTSLNGSCPRDRKMSTQVSALAINRTHRYGSR